MASTSPTNRDPPCQPSPLPSISYLDDILYDIVNDDINTVWNDSFVDTVDEVSTEILTGAPETRNIDETSNELSTMFGIMTLEGFPVRAGVVEENKIATPEEFPVRAGVEEEKNITTQEEFLIRAGVEEENKIITLEEFLLRAGVIEDNMNMALEKFLLIAGVVKENKAMQRKERRRFKSRQSAATFRDRKQAYSVDCEITGGGGMSQVSAREGELLRQALSVEVLESSTHNEPETDSSLSCSETSESEGDAPQHLSRNMQFLSEKSSEGSEGDGNASPEHTAAGKMPKRTAVKAIKHKKQTGAAERDVGYAMATASQPSSFQTMKIIPQHEVEENSCIKDTSEREKQSKKDITFQCISEHFGRPLDDAAKSFGVSRSTFKRICRDLGIKRWQYGKRRMDGKIPSKLEGRLNAEEPSTGNFSCWDTTPVQNKLVRDSHRNQGLNKMTVKATYKGVTIRFELPATSGIAELENNVIERLHLQRENFSIKYQDNEGDWILIACDKDVQECLQMSRTLSKTTVKMLLDLPYNPHAP